MKKSKLREYKKILTQIDKYYPKECEFNSKEYKKTKEYRKYKKKINDLALFKQKQKEYFDLLCSVFPEYHIKCWTNTTYPCFQFSVLLNKNQPILDDDIKLMEALDGRRLNLEIFISRISKYYYVYTSEELYDLEGNERWTFHSYCATHALKKRIFKKLKKKMKKAGLKKLSRKIAHMKVPFLETGLLPMEDHEVEVFNCLFSDMVIDYY